ncbi:MAG: LysM peptidoglycan-binding domain-containing protein [Verrucomicrobiota bacterium]
MNLKFFPQSLLGAAGLLVLTACNTFETRAPRRAPLPYPGKAQAARPLAARVPGVKPVPSPQPTRPLRPAPQPSGGALEQEIRANATFRNEMRMQLDQITTENARLNAEIMSLRQARPAVTPSASDSEIRLLKARIDELEAQLQAVEASAHANSRQIQLIPGKIKALLEKYQGGQGGGRTVAPKSGTRAGSTVPQTGYDHIVATGETLSAIASAYEVSARRIIEANGLTDPDNLKIGQKLFIPE